ncbi:hypothetical protein [Ruminococcus sp. XPD3002]|uniref:hypothetical protein n=1 Tax=Ruminococcus sp. XPD3002 TaxID=1452269 RepID=UPI000917BC9B|nr:hypothetical protein SAMN04487832_11126 [Ruminococcus flavefaciens]
MGLSAKRLGKLFGLNSQEMNVYLKEEGYLKGEPGNYSLTKKGEKYATKKEKDNGYGGHAARHWSWTEWAEEIVEKINIDSKRRAEIEQHTSEQRKERRIKKDREYEEYMNKMNSQKQETPQLDILSKIIKIFKK